MLTRDLYPDAPPAGFKAATGKPCVALADDAHAANYDRVKLYCKSKLTVDVAVLPASSPDLEKHSRVVCIGSNAGNAVLGGGIPVNLARGGYGWKVFSDHVTPILWVFDIADKKDNGFFCKQWCSDLEAAFKVEPERHWRSGIALHAIETQADALEACADLITAGDVAFDVETIGKVFSHTFAVVTLAAATSAGKVYVWGERALTSEGTVAPLRRWLESKAGSKVGHNVKFDVLAVQYFLKCKVGGTLHDTRLQWKLIEPDSRAGLKVCSHLVGLGGYKEAFDAEVKRASKLITAARRAAAKSESQLTLFDQPRPIAWALQDRDARTETYAYGLTDDELRERYCAQDAHTTIELHKSNLKKLDNLIGPRMAYNLLVQPAIGALSAVEQTGIAFDREYLAQSTEPLAHKRAEVAEKINAYGIENPSSSQQVAAVLFDAPGLPSQNKSKKTGLPSTDDATLKALKGKHEVVDLLLDYRHYDKLVSTYGESLLSHARADDRIHPNFNLDGTRTGRLSCTDPNLQQIPRAEIYADGTANDGKLIKDCFVSPPGYYLLQFDYSQLELRVAAMLSDDPVMIDMFNSGKDFHAATAALVAPIMWGVPTETVWEWFDQKDTNEAKQAKAYRTQAKVFNFGLLYGMTDGGLAARIGCEREEAAKLRTAILGKWVKLSAWLAKVENEARKTGYTHTEFFGQRARRRQVFNIASKDRLTASRGKNASINTPVQGTASDYCLASLASIVRWLEADGIDARVVLTVHDSIILECRDDLVLDVVPKVREIMTTWPSGRVTLVADCDIGRRWGSLEAFEKWQAR